MTFLHFLFFFIPGFILGFCLHFYLIKDMPSHTHQFTKWKPFPGRIDDGRPMQIRTCETCNYEELLIVPIKMK